MNELPPLMDHIREEFLDKLPPKIRDRLKQVEQQRELGRLAKAITGKLESKSVTKIEHNEQEMTSKEDIEKVLLQINHEKIRASDDTPFMQEPLRSEFGYRNETEAADLVTEGAYVPPIGTSPAVRKLLTELKRPQGINQQCEVTPP